MPKLADELRERLKLRYMGDCKCGHCSLVPDELVAKSADRIQLLEGALSQLARAADVVDLLLRKEYPAEASSLRQLVAYAKAFESP